MTTKKQLPVKGQEVKIVSTGQSAICIGYADVWCCIIIVRLNETNVEKMYHVKDLDYVIDEALAKVPEKDRWIMAEVKEIKRKYPKIRITRKVRQDEDSESNAYKPYLYDEISEIYLNIIPYLTDKYNFKNYNQALEDFVVTVDKLAKKLKRSFGGVVAQFIKTVFYISVKQQASTTDAFRENNGLVLCPNATTTNIMQTIVKYGAKIK